MFNLSQPLSHIVAKLVLDGKEYDIEDFKVGFDQPIDFKGQPQQETKGGQLYIILSQGVDDNIYDWAKRSTKLKDGKVVFQTEFSNSPLEIEFEDAYCTKLTRTIDAYSGTKTDLLICPEIIRVNGIQHDNDWRR